ncbi:MAG: class I SAM-dependent methyltransferase, partial [Prochlorothrix sp.]
MDRILEPEIMADQAQVMAYAKADFRTSSDRFISGFVSTFAEQIQGQNSHILDLGCGPGDIPIALAQIIPKIQITALDASQSMLDLARSRITTAALAHRIHLLQASVPDKKVIRMALNPYRV